MDGGDDRLPLQALDHDASLARQVDVVQRELVHLHPEGRTSRMEVYLTGDGKGMQVMHYKEGCRCWVCNNPYQLLEHLVVSDQIASHLRAGSFLWSIPLGRRVGDYAHCMCRVMNAVLPICVKNLNTNVTKASRRLCKDAKPCLSSRTSRYHRKDHASNSEKDFSSLFYHA